MNYYEAPVVNSELIPSRVERVRERSALKIIMITQKRYLSTAVFLLFTIINAFAQKFTASANKTRVGLGEAFQIEYTVNTSASKFTPPNLNDFTILGGPNQSQSMSFVNGQMSSSLSYSYYLSPKKEGTFTIGPASIVADGKTLQSNSLKIEVVKGSTQSQQQQQRGNPYGSQQQQQRQQQTTNAGNIADNVFLKCSIDKSTAYVGEQVIATFKLYTRVNIVGTQANEMPKFNGFWNEDIKKDNATQYTESLDGIQYTVAEIKKTILFPQRSGKLEIEPLDLQVVVRQRVQSNSIFDQMFGGSVRDVPVSIQSKKVVLNVLPLPEPKPDNFTGISGKLSMDASISKEKLKTNDAVTLKINVTGKGNLKLIETPKPEFPSDIEAYDPKTNDNISVSSKGISGSRVFEYLLIPRAAGTFSIPPITLSYFDTDSKSYKTLTSRAFNLEVEKGTGEEGGNQVYVPSANKQDVKVIGNDIRYIQKENDLKKAGSYFFRSASYYLTLVIAFLAMLGYLGYERYQHRQSKDVVAMKSRKATKIAVKRLEAAKAHLTQNNSNAFYAEVIKALQGYISDKYNLPLAEISGDTIAQTLRERNKEENTVQQFLNVIKDCEFARYAPSAAAPMNTIYEQAVSLIEKIES